MDKTRIIQSATISKKQGGCSPCHTSWCHSPHDAHPNGLKPLLVTDTGLFMHGSLLQGLG